jgi:hypothetical protein
MSTQAETKASNETRQHSGAPADQKPTPTQATIKINKPRPEINPLQRLLDLSA